MFARKISFLLILLVTFCALTISSFSQNKGGAAGRYKAYSKWGVFLDVDFNSLNADLRQLPSVPDYVPLFGDGTNTGLSLGGFYELPVAGKLYLQLRGYLKYQKGNITVSENRTINVSGQDVNAVIEHNLKSDLTSVCFEPLIKFEILDKLAFLGGGTVGYRFSGDFTHNEAILSPAGTLFPDGTARNEVAGDIIGKRPLYAALTIGLSYEFPINFQNSYLVSPEIIYSNGYADFGENSTWDVNSIRAGVSVKFANIPASDLKVKEIRRNLQNIDTVKIQSPEVADIRFSQGTPRMAVDSVLSDQELTITDILSRTDTLFIPQPAEKKYIPPPFQAYISARGVLANVEDGEPDLRVEEFHSTNIQPLLNYIFFDEGKSDLPGRYHKLSPSEVSSFSVDSLFNESTLNTYYQVLNIIGRRMNENPKTNITVTGCNSGADGEEASLELSEARAESVASYLEKTWKIDKKRISIKSRNLPEFPSKSGYADGEAENRRVEITSSTWEIISPVITANNALRVATPPVIRFYPSVQSSQPLSSWRLDIIQKGKMLKLFTGKDSLPAKFDWRINDDKQAIPPLSYPMEYKLSATDTSGQTAVSRTGSIPVKQITIADKKLNKAGDKKIDRYSLILFDYNSSSLSKANSRIVDFVSKKIEKNSNVMIEGYTDRSGSDDYNLTLSLARAKNVARSLNAADPAFEGFGEKVLLYDNDLPEGRFYCRTVNIIVETPFKE